MKTIKFSVLIGLILSLAFASCKKDDPEVQAPPSSTSAKNFFTIENATFNTGSLPQGSLSLISDLTINSTVITGGSTIVSFCTTEKIKTAFISIKGVDGYYQYDFPADYEPEEVLRASLRYYYELILNIVQNLTANEFTISISCLTASGGQSSSVDTEEILVKEVGTGKLQISLSWDQFDDLDLHLLEPSGNRICYWNRSSLDSDRTDFEFSCYLINKYTSHDVSSLDYNNYEDRWLVYEYLEDVPWNAYYNEYDAFYAESKKNGGYLDLDSNAGCSLDRINNENITYENDPALGIYYVAVDLYSKCDSSKPGAKYSVTVNYNGQLVTISDRQSRQFDADDNGSYENTSKFHVIGGFEITASGIRPVSVTNNPFYSGYDDYGTLRSAKAKFLKNK